jgi:tetratricopeptide (TPR) repeat protein
MPPPSEPAAEAHALNPVASPAVHPGFRSQSVFHDVWSSEQELCAYCATPLNSLADQRRCPGCRRFLLISYYRYPQPTTNLHAYWVLLVGLGQLFLLQLFVDLILGGTLRLVIVDLLVMAVAFVLAVGIYFRQFWAYLLSILFLLALATAMAFNIVSGGALLNLLAGGERVVIGDMTLFTDTFRTVLAQLLVLFQPLQLVTAALALILALFYIAPDFERVQVRQAAHVDRGLREATTLYAAGKEYARQGMWATAVRHFQRAAAADPFRATYTQALGQAYTVLGFRERALDALQTAHKAATYPPLQAEIAALIDKLQQEA